MTTRTSSFRSCGEAVLAALILVLATGCGPVARTAGPGRLLVRSDPGECAVFLDGAFVGVTGDESCPLEIGLSGGVHEIRVTHPGRQDATSSVEAKPGIETTVLATLAGPNDPCVASGDPPLLGVGQMVRARFPRTEPRVIRYRIRANAGEKRLVVLEIPGLTARVLGPKGDEVALAPAAPVVELPRSQILELTVTAAGDHVLEIGTKGSEFAVVRYLAAPPPQAKNPDGSLNRRRLPASK